MAFRFFRIPVSTAVEWEDELNGFLRSHRVLQVERRFVEDGQDSFWSLCVDYQVAGTGKGAYRAGASRERTDYREVLSAEAFARFVKLRQMRKDVAAEEAIPVYLVFTNEQLAEIAKAGSVSRASLEQIEGVGGAKVEKYAERVMGALQEGSGSGAVA